MNLIITSICPLGTKWCGPGHVAKSYDDLGEHRETDICCRDHDKHCKARIDKFSRKYGLWNWSWKTASHCDCEQRFKDCLLNVSMLASKSYLKQLVNKVCELKTGVFTFLC